jgi:hypothetical protein
MAPALSAECVCLNPRIAAGAGSVFELGTTIDGWA